MPNIYEQFKELLPGDPQKVAKLIDVGSVFSQVQYLGGEAVGGEFGFNGIVERVQGTGTLNSLVYVKGGVIVGPAPSLPLEEIVIYGL